MRECARFVCKGGSELSGINQNESGAIGSSLISSYWLRLVLIGFGSKKPARKVRSCRAMRVYLMGENRVMTERGRYGHGWLVAESFETARDELRKLCIRKV